MSILVVIGSNEQKYLGRKNLLTYAIHPKITIKSYPLHLKIVIAS